MKKTRWGRWARWDRQIEVDVITLDFLVDRYGIPAFCKIDVEGSEPNVFTRFTYAIPVLSFEFTPTLPDNTAYCVQRINQLGKYEFNWTLGETYRFQFNRWKKAKEIVDDLHILSRKNSQEMCMLVLLIKGKDNVISLSDVDANVVPKVLLFW